MKSLESSITHALLIAYFKKLKYLFSIVTFCTIVVNIFTGKRCNNSSEDLRDGAGTAENPVDPHRLLERGVALHGVSADEDEETDDDNPREMTEEEEATAKAVLDDPSYDQEGLALTGGDWFMTIKKAALESKLTEKELAARMKKAKISQSSLENEVFMGTPSCHSSADTGPGTLQTHPPPPPASHPPQAI